jgi:hypothetical protein
MVSFDLTNGYYTLDKLEEERYLYTVNYRSRGNLYRLAGLPMDWECGCYYFCRLAKVFIRYLREPLPNPTKHTARMSTSK